METSEVIDLKGLALATLASIVATRKRLADDILITIKDARRNGATWEEVGEAMGVSKQSAWEHYSHLV